MSTRKRITLPTTGQLSGSLRIPASHPSVPKTLLKLSRPSLLSLVQEWLKPRNQVTCGPVLGNEENNNPVDITGSPYDPVQTLDEVREVYSELESRKGGKREVVDRILEGDWRHGLSLRQMAMLDVQYLLDHQSSQRWTARRIARITQNSKKEEAEEAAPNTLQELPRFHGKAFIKSLQEQLGSVLKAHYYLTHLRTLPISLLRICVHESPYNSQSSIIGSRRHAGGNAVGTGSGAGSFKTIYLAFPDHSQFVYIATAVSGQPGPSLSSASDIRKLVIDATSRALSEQHNRYTLKSTSLAAKSLSVLISLRGPEGTNAAGGGWSIFADGTVDPSPLSACEKNSADEQEIEQDDRMVGATAAGGASKRPLNALDPEFTDRKRRKKIAATRFGSSSLPDDGKGIDRLDVRLENVFPERREALAAGDKNAGPRRNATKGKHDTQGSDDGDDWNTESAQSPWRPRIELTFHGTHVFAGLRALVESGAIDGTRMPGWMTGENGISTGVVRDGLIRGNKGVGF